MDAAANFAGVVVVADRSGVPEVQPLIVQVDGPLLERVKTFHRASREWREQRLEDFGAWLVRRGLSCEINDSQYLERLRPGGRECA